MPTLSRTSFRLAAPMPRHFDYLPKDLPLALHTTRYPRVFLKTKPIDNYDLRSYITHILQA